MKVAINAWFYDQVHVGSGQYLRYLIPELVKANAELDIILVVPAHKTAVDQAKGGAVFAWPDRVVVEPVPVRPGNLGKVWFEQVQFPRTAKALGVDLAHVPYFGSALSPQVPTIVTVHDLIPMVLPAYRGNALIRMYTSLVAAAASNADLILADSDASRQDILTHLSVSPEKVRTIHLAPAPQYQPIETWTQVEYITKKYNLPDPYILYIGGYDTRKNIRALLHAWTFVVKGLGDTLHLVLAGNLPEEDTPFFPDPLKIARELGIEDYIVTPGWIEEVDKPLLYGAARAFVYPSKYEGFGLPVLEAMACGTPVVTTNVSSLPELAGPDAFQVDPNDTRRLASPLIALTIQEETHNDMANRGYERAAQFTWQKTAAETWQAYQDVLS
ncbi:MAG: glycosyltransferase family 1 protein [Chloroflexota bacterium]